MNYIGTNKIKNPEEAKGNYLDVADKNLGENQSRSKKVVRLQGMKLQ